MLTLKYGHVSLKCECHESSEVHKQTPYSESGAETQNREMTSERTARSGVQSQGQWVCRCEFWDLLPLVCATVNFSTSHSVLGPAFLLALYCWNISARRGSRSKVASRCHVLDVRGEPPGDVMFLMLLFVFIKSQGRVLGLLIRDLS